MSSSAKIGVCSICLGNVTTGQAIFTGECSHSFHFGCVSNNVSHGNYLCPICHAKWNSLPFPMPNADPNSGVFSDDEPLPTISTDSTSSHSGLQRIHIKSIPERPAIASSESVSEFALLVGIRAPPLLDNARRIDRAPIDLVTVLDVSGSMRGSKIDLLKRAVHFVIDNLGPSDRLSIVSFSCDARRIFPMRRMTGIGREDAKRAVDSLYANGMTNIVEGLKKGVRVLEERQQQNPVSSIIFLSDGNDTCYDGPNHKYLQLLPGSISPKNRASSSQTFPVHTFGFGSDHDPIAMHAIADESGGTFSFIESYEMVQDAFASCIGGLLSVVVQEVRLTLKSASKGVQIKSVCSGRYANEISGQGCEGVIDIRDMYADEEKEFLVHLLVPNDEENDGKKTSLLDIVCSYRDVVSKERVRVEGSLVEIRRPKIVSPEDMAVNVQVDRQRNRVWVAEAIAEAQRIAEGGNLTDARDLLSQRMVILGNSVSARAGDDHINWLESELEEVKERMKTHEMYNLEGRAYALSGMSSFAYQRASTRGHAVPGAERKLRSGGYGGFATPNMARMVNKSQQLNKVATGLRLLKKVCR